VLSLTPAERATAGIRRPDAVGLLGGRYSGAGSDAISGVIYDYEYTKFGSAPLMGLHALWIFESELFKTDYYRAELRWITYETALTELGVHFGDLRAFPLSLSARIGSSFENSAGTSGAIYVTFGLGTLIPSFKKGEYLEALEALGISTSVDNDPGVCLNVGLGMEIFLRPNRIGVEVNLEYVLAGTNTDWVISDTTVGDFEFLHPGGWMLMVGLNYHFPRETRTEAPEDGTWPGFSP